MKKIIDEASAFNEKMAFLIEKFNINTLLDLPFLEVNDYSFQEKIPYRLCVLYFLLHEKKGILYIGKAHNLRSRWRLMRNEKCPDEFYEIHHMHEIAVNFGDVRLTWIEINKDILSMIEYQFIKNIKTKWNSRIY